MSASHILVVEDNPITRKLLRLALESAGYEVSEAGDGEAALACAAARRLDFVVLDYALPDIDGLSLLAEIRRAGGTAELAALMVTGMVSRLEELGSRAGRLVEVVAKPLEPSRLLEIVRARLAPSTPTAQRRLERSLDLPAPGTAPREHFSVLYRERLRAQLERQTSRNEILVRQAAIQAAALSVIRGLSETLAQPHRAARVVSDVLVHCLDATGLSTGLLYLFSPDGRPRLEAQFGIPLDSLADAERCFGRPDLLRRVVDKGQPLAWSASQAAGGNDARELFARLGQHSTLMVPFVVLGESYGVLVLASDSLDLAAEEWLGFARSLAAQFGQTVALGQSLGRLAASESRHRALMEQAHDAILILDLPHRVLEANREAERLLGRPRAEIVGRHYDDFVVPEERQDSARVRERFLSAETVRVENRHLLRGDGTPVPVEISAALVRVGELFDEKSVLLILRDVSERQSLSAQLLQAQKMESLGRLAGGVAHDFNNLLGIITGYAELLRDRLLEDRELASYTDDILKAAERAGSLTRQLLAFSRRQVLQPRLLDLSAVVRESERMLRRVIGEDLLLETRLADGLPRVRADVGQLEQVVMNLAVNARDAMPRGGRLRLETTLLELDEDYARTHPEVQPGHYVALVVSDTGHGMPPEVRARIFEPFFTTKEAGKGTGLGLATVHGVVRQSGGHVSVYSEVGQGTTFKICLPVAAEAPAESAASALPAEVPRGTETLLVVEDEPALGEIVRRGLEALGYTVLLAVNAAQAIERSERHAGAIDLLVTDVVMPGQGGSQLAQKLAASRPGVKTLFMSGFTDDAVLLHGVLTETMAYIEKPFTAAALARKVRAVLDAAPVQGANHARPPAR